MDNYQLRSEIATGSVPYYLQSNIVPDRNAVLTSMFHDGRLLSTRTEPCDSTLPPDALRALVRETHEGHRARILSLLALRDRLRKGVDGRAHMKLGEAFYRQRLYREAMGEIVRAIKLGTEGSLGYSILGNCLLATDEAEKALKAFRKGLDNSPRYPDLHNDLGVAFLRLEKCRDAVEAFERALELNPYYTTAFLNLGIAITLNVVLKQDYDLSRDLSSRLSQVLDMMIQLNPGLDGETYRSAVRAAREERYDVVHSSLVELREARMRVPDDDLSLELYLLLKFPAGGLSEADVDTYIERVRRAIDANPGWADLLNTLGVLYTAKCKLFIDKANGAFEEALRINPEFGQAGKNLKLVSNDRQGIHFLLKALLD